MNQEIEIKHLEASDLLNKVTETMGKHRQRSAMRIILPDGRTETKVENTNNIGVHSYCLWPWENKIISP